MKLLRRAVVGRREGGRVSGCTFNVAVLAAMGLPHLLNTLGKRRPAPSWEVRRGPGMIMVTATSYPYKTNGLLVGVHDLGKLSRGLKQVEDLGQVVQHRGCLCGPQGLVPRVLEVRCLFHGIIYGHQVLL